MTERPLGDEDQEHIRKLVDTWPPLSPAQRARLAAIVAPPVKRRRRRAAQLDKPAKAG